MGGGDIAIPGVIRLLVAQLAVFLALLLALSAVHKALRWSHTRAVVHEFGGVPRAAAGAAAAGALLAEMLAAALLLVPAWRASGALLAALLWGAYLALMLHRLRKGRRDVDCGCSFGTARHALGAFAVVRNAVLVACAVLVGVSAAGGAEPVAASQVLAAAAFLALYAALDQLQSLPPLRRGAAL
jgi:hypothetical protein